MVPSWLRAGGQGSIPGQVIPKDLKNGTSGLPSLVLGVDGWVQGNSSRVELLSARHQCSIHCERAEMGEWP